MIEANGAELYCEIRGDGPAVLFITPATGDCGLYERMTRALADEFTCVTFDRRGNSRSPRPPGWNRTTIEEQAADVVGVLKATVGAPAMVFGSSGGGTVALGVMVNHPEWVTGMILHEPALPSVLTRDQLRAVPQQDPRILQALRESGPRAAIEVRLRLVIGDAIWEGLAEEQRQRMLGNAETLLLVETDVWSRYRPDETALRRFRPPVVVLVSPESPESNLAVRDWLLREIPQATTGLLPGNHVPYLEMPEGTASVLRGHLRQL